MTTLKVLRDSKRETPFAADERLKVLRQSFDTRKDGKAIVPNVARLVEPFAVHTDGQATATPEELAEVHRTPWNALQAVLCVAIMMFTGFRVSDVSRLGPQHRRRDMFKLRLFKNCNRIEIAIHPILEAVLAMHKVTDLTYIATEFGKPFLATDVAHNEATDGMIEAMFAWRDGKTSKFYTKMPIAPAWPADGRTNQLGWRRYETAGADRRKRRGERINREHTATPGFWRGGTVQVRTATPRKLPRFCKYLSMR
ncbi:hypothetical protein RWK44_04630 [Rhizobium sp. 25PS6]|uniref:hypothetical protein n=1 Tax=Rhizobium sp. 25PS6 TaxID=3075622 RepID=UPI0028FD2059|nr:hypothetical protein [Rhizobium sp. 25PS6]MDU0359703.1 hypothetical protein [Rhizobium sp. 25PS6]